MHPETLIPVICTAKELIHQKVIVDRLISEVCEKYNLKKLHTVSGLVELILVHFCPTISIKKFYRKTHLQPLMQMAFGDHGGCPDSVQFYHKRVWIM